MRIEVYKCSHCGTLHETEKAFKSCEKICAVEKADALKSIELRRNKQAMLDYQRLNATSFEQLIQLCKEKAKDLYNADLDFTLDIRYSPQVSNTHDAPIGKKLIGCVTNLYLQAMKVSMGQFEVLPNILHRLKKNLAVLTFSVILLTKASAGFTPEQVVVAVIFDMG